MPSATSLSQFILTNFGPLTTTWTAPQSCATLAHQAVYLAPTWRPDVGYYGSACAETSPVPNCYPGGATQINEIFTEEKNMWVGGFVPYYSPGLYCPDKYTTAGIAIKDGTGKLVSSSGMFAPTKDGTMIIGPGPETYTATETLYLALSSTSVTTTTATTTFAPQYNPHWNVFMEALAPSETAVVCCPSGYSANFQGDCYSNVPRSLYTASTACEAFLTGNPTIDGLATVNVTFTYAGIAVTGEANIQTASVLATQTTVETMPTGTDADVFTGIKFAPMATLVHRASDNAAPRAITGDFSTLVGVWTTSALVGAMLMVSV